MPDPTARARVPRDAESLEEILRAAYSRMLAARPEASPGTYKTIANRAGQTIFVAPQLIRGTLDQGLDRYLALPPGFQRAAFAMFLVSEIHPSPTARSRRPSAHQRRAQQRPPTAPDHAHCAP